jgi:excisionase family DNA binding protein
VLSLSPWTIRRYITDGKLKTVRLGRRVLIEPSELQRLVEEGRESRGQSDSQ